MKILILFLIIPFAVYANEIEVIEIHENKSLDQMVLDLSNEQLKIEDENTVDHTSKQLNEDNLDQNISDQVDTLELANIEDKKNFLLEIQQHQVSQILNNAKNIKSQTLQDELNNYLTNLNLDYDNSDSEHIFYSIVDYFYQIGFISKSYSLIKSRIKQNDQNLNFYNFLEINYLLSTSQLEDTCNFKNELSIDLNLQNNFIDKVEIFCLILENKFSEAELLNSIMLETEEIVDQNFQQLFSILVNEKDTEIYKQNLSLTDFNSDLIFLYSAMARIAEIPLNEEFLKLDPLNLAIPIILNKSTPINLRLKAANKSFINGYISIESLAALYQSVDFDSDQLNNPEETKNKLSESKELLMAYHFQFVNIQIFPSERLDALIHFWNFAKDNNLENIAYSLSNKIVDSIEIKSDFLEHGPLIAMSYINNKNLDKANNWINLYEDVKGIDDQSTLVKFLINIHSTNDVNEIINIISTNYENLIKFSSKNSEELFFILYSIFDSTKTQTLQKDFENIYDKRLSASLFISESLQNAIVNSEHNKFLIYSIISLNNMNWRQIHPSHLKLILKGFLSYKNDIILKNIIIEIFEDYNLL